ncbi:DUF2089 domain-containing protein [Tessaracoccus sp. OH4464_COT-324]|uniref:DUF2089 domain-containing protein n=1 Tax=Tessaracoccus sp. OH4464_COT-324 TaxID=2491059 RepID=UPI000F635426|nr:DUF2089 domain-containing protein [Tessaracoccus sp. OH4464_COT-324]RRD46473.1 DUF2089 domain-containing protein [Tessaracoccus sp. OH4464_COT-324]
MSLHRAPADCPVCGDNLIVITKGCQQCGTELRGQFAGTEFDLLDEAELELLRVFLASRGNLREVEKHLKVSYPTARSRFDAVLAKLGLTPGGEEPSGDAREAAAADTDDVLARVARGELSAHEAATLLG